MTKANNPLYQKRLELYNKLVQNNINFDRKGKTMPYTSVNGHMFSFLDKEGNICLRLSDNDRNEFSSKYNSEPVEQYGKVMKEYVEVPNELLNDFSTLEEYLQKSFDYVSCLKPKPTK